MALGGLLWTVFTLLTPFSASAGFPYLICCRVWLGMGEGLASPAIQSLLAKWCPLKEISRSVAIVSCASYFGAVLALFVSPIIVAVLSWQWIFYIFAAMSLLWSIFWQFGTASCPSQWHGIPHIEIDEVARLDYDNKFQLQQDEGGHIMVHDHEASIRTGSPVTLSLETHRTDAGVPFSQDIPWRIILCERAVWAICISQFGHLWGHWIQLTWLPTFYQQKFNQSILEIGIFTSMHHVSGMNHAWCVSSCSIHHNRHFWHPCWHRRRLFDITETDVCPACKEDHTVRWECWGGLFFLLAACSTNVYLSVLLVAVSKILSTLTLLGANISQHDIAPKYAGMYVSI